MKHRRLLRYFHRSGLWSKQLRAVHRWSRQARGGRALLSRSHSLDALPVNACRALLSRRRSLRQGSLLSRRVARIRVGWALLRGSPRPLEEHGQRHVGCITAIELLRGSASQRLPPRCAALQSRNIGRVLRRTGGRVAASHSRAGAGRPLHDSGHRRRPKYSSPKSGVWCESAQRLFCADVSRRSLGWQRRWQPICAASRCIGPASR